MASPFKSNIRLEAENTVLRHQPIILRRKLNGRARLTNDGRWFFVQLYRWLPSILSGSRDYSTRNAVALASGRLPPLLVLELLSTGGRPQIETELRALIQQMSTENF